MGLVQLSSLRLCNHVTDQFSRFELTRGRKPVEMNSGLSGYELISIFWNLLLSDSYTSCRLRLLDCLYIMGILFPVKHTLSIVCNHSLAF